jgi:hypothetical protein
VHNTFLHHVRSPSKHWRSDVVFLWKKPEKPTDMPKVTDKFYYQVHLATDGNQINNYSGDCTFLHHVRSPSKHWKAK